MDLLQPIKEIMTTNVTSVRADDSLHKVAKIFDENTFHHVPVVEGRELLGLISKSDILLFKRGLSKGASRIKNIANDHENQLRLKSYLAEDIMTKGIAKLESTDRVDVALEVFKENLFHCIPVVDDGIFVGILTTFDIIDHISNADRVSHVS